MIEFSNKIQNHNFTTMNNMLENKVIKKINKNLSLINSTCQNIVEKYQKSSEMSHKDYVYFVLSADIFYRIKDIIFLNKKLKEAKNNFDSSLYVLSRSVLETFIFLKYLLCEQNKITLRLHAFICHSSKNDINMLNALKLLGENNKFIFNKDDKNILSLKMIIEKISEWQEDINERKTAKTINTSELEKEIKILGNIKKVSEEYDKINQIDKVIEGEENKSLEWMYDYVYKFQCMSAHQNLRDKEKVFKLYTENKKAPNNIHILGLLEDISKQIINLGK